MPSSVRVPSFLCLACAILLSSPAPTAAQTSDAASLAGVVRDASGGVLPGVTVEVASPVLIEKVGLRSPTARGSTAWWTCGPAATA